MQTSIPQIVWFIKGRKKNYVLILAACLAVAFFGMAYLVATLHYDYTKDQILEDQKKKQESWLTGTADRIILWRNGLENQVRRISGAEQYQIFATEIKSLGVRLAERINNEMPLDGARNRKVEELATRLPVLRNQLREFIQTNGFNDARIATVQGQTLLSSVPRQNPVTGIQQTVIAQAVKTGRMAIAPVRSDSGHGLTLDLADPIDLTPDATEKQNPALLVSIPITSQIVLFLSRNVRQLDKAVPRLLQERNNSFAELRVETAKPVPLIATDRLQKDSQQHFSFARRPSLDGRSTVYSSGVHLPVLQWWVVLELPVEEVDAYLRSQAWICYGTATMVGFTAMVLISLLWWIVIGCEEQAIIGHFQSLYTVIKQQKQLLDSVNISLEVGLLMLAQDGTVQVCNRGFSRMIGKEESELLGLPLSALFEVDVCGRMLDAIRQVEESKMSNSLEITLIESAFLPESLTDESPQDSEHNQLYRVTFYPFVDRDGKSDGVVATFQNITVFRKESERRRKMQMNTIEALICAIESVDPYLKGHSRMVAGLVDLVGWHLHLQSKDQEILRTAASLCQINKLFITRDLLTKTTALTNAEHEEIKRSPDHAWNILREIHFDKPVTRAIHEMYERVDGTGYPQGLHGDEISIHARVLGVINAFAAIVSPRSFRTGMPLEQAIAALEKDKGLDQQVVTVLKIILHTPEGIQLATPRNTFE